jgi:hypothetical protein
MSIRTIQVAECDSPHCITDTIIDTMHDAYIDAGAYGCAFHVECWHAMSGQELAIALNLDNIIRKNAGNTGGNRITEWS